ncbi:Vacuolar cation/proton exchanger 1-like protein [Drosera capensis]
MDHIREERSLEEGLLVNGGSARWKVSDKCESTMVVVEQTSLIREFMANVWGVMFGTKLWVLFPAFPLAILAHHFELARPWIFALSLLGLAPLAERVSFLTEQIANYTGPTVGGLMNATCGNATELIIAILALYRGKIHVLKYSLLGSILSNILLVLGSSLLLGGVANLNKEQKFDTKPAEVNVLLLSMGVLCHLLPVLFSYATEPGTFTHLKSIVQLSRASGIVMLVAYFGYLFFQLKAHNQVLEAKQEDEDGEDDTDDNEKPVLGFWSASAWLVGMTLAIALLSEYIVGTIEDASRSWGISISFLSIILLPILGNAAEHAGALIFAYKNKLDLSLGIALGSATQISMFVVPLCLLVAWIIGVKMDLELGVLETGSLAFSIIMIAFTLQDGTSHYMKGVALLLCYVVISVCFLLQKSPTSLVSGPSTGSAAA